MRLRNRHGRTPQSVALKLQYLKIRLRTYSVVISAPR